MSPKIFKLQLRKELILFWLKKTILVNFCLFLVFIPYFRNISKTFLIIGSSLWFFLAILKDQKYFYRTLFTPNYLTKPVLIFIFASVISVIFSINPYHSQKVFFSRYVMYFVFFLIGSGLAANFKILEFKVNSLPKNVFFLAVVIIFSGIILGLGGVRDFFIFKPPRLYTSFGKEVPFSMLPIFLTFFLTFSLSFVLYSRSWVRTVGIMSLFLLIPCWIWAASRAGWMTGIFGIMIVFLFFLKGKQKLILSIILILIMIILFLFIGNNHVHSRLINFFDRGTFGGRDLIIGKAFDIFRINPLFGAGLGMYGKIYKENPPTPQIHLHAHNTYLEVLAELGIVGFLAFSLIFILFFKKLFFLVNINSIGDQRAFFIGSLGVFSAVLFFELFSSSILVGMEFATLFWFFLGIVSAISNPMKLESRV